MKVVKVVKSENKTDKKGNQYQSIMAKVLYNNAELTAFINSYAGPVNVNDMIDDSLAEEKQGNNGEYLSVFMRQAKKGEIPTHIPAPAAAPKVLKADYTPEELEQLMDKCIEYAGKQIEKLSKFGVPVENINTIINTLFISMKDRGIRAKDWTAPIVSTPQKDTWLWEINDWIKEGLITQLMFNNTIKLTAKRESAFLELTDGEAKMVYQKMKVNAGKVEITDDTGSNPTPVVPK